MSSHEEDWLLQVLFTYTVDVYKDSCYYYYISVTASFAEICLQMTALWLLVLKRKS